MERKWTDRQYHIQDNADVTHQDVRMYLKKKSIPSINFLWYLLQTSWRKGVD